ncbi:DDB1- and CUL4-associated factor 8 [Cocos nucifera]|uniref:DDB1- and CUL4-associated factor 8 n=1 Tax=Cocos nucifera TaxID=13894 RepID=A0A8K0N117_COCNU|nr:DDB1- and CUL4-associated factor 8 [Cocos nucifera]
MVPGRGVKELWDRELGASRPRVVARRIQSHEAFVKRMSFYGDLNGHQGCVNTIHFNPAGNLLVSGSDDKDIIVWNWATKSKEIIYHSGHLDNVFEVRVMPYTDDRTIITSAADGQVRVGQIMENGQVTTRHLGLHNGRVHGLAIEQGTPHVFYSCGEDGFVQRFDLRTHAPTKLLLCSSFLGNGQPIRLNAMVIDPCNPYHFSIGGSDEYARVYDMRNCRWDASSTSNQPMNIFCPCHLFGTETVHITGLAYSSTSELLVSYNDELIYLFSKNMGLGPDPQSVKLDANLQKLITPQVYSGHRNFRTVKGVNFFGPGNEYVVSGSDCGHVYIWKKEGGELMCMMGADTHIVNCVEPHPHDPVLATSGYDTNIKIWTPVADKLCPLPRNAKQIMAANKRCREARARITLSPDVVMHVLRLQRRQASTSAESRPSSVDTDSDEDDDDVFAFFRCFLEHEQSGTSGGGSDIRDCTVC